MHIVQHEPVGTLGPLSIGVVREPPLEMAEGVLVGHQLDAVVGAGQIEPAHVVEGHRRRIGPDGSVIPVGERVLGVELKLVEATDRQALDQPRQGFACGDSIAADVEHEPTRGQIGMILDHAVREHGLASLELSQRLQSVPPAVGIGETELCRTVANRELVPLGRE